MKRANYVSTTDLRKSLHYSNSEISRLALAAWACWGQEEQDYEKYWTGLDALRKQIDALVDKAKASGSIPRGTTLKRLTLMPKTKPARWGNVFKRIFGRKTRKTATKKKMVKAKAKITRQKQQRKAT